MKKAIAIVLLVLSYALPLGAEFFEPGSKQYEASQRHKKERYTLRNQVLL